MNELKPKEEISNGHNDPGLLRQIGSKVLNLFQWRTSKEGQLEAEREEIIEMAERALNERTKEKSAPLPTYAGNPGLDPEHPHIFPGQE
jgi:hypothetical protein